MRPLPSLALIAIAGCGAAPARPAPARDPAPPAASSARWLPAPPVATRQARIALESDRGLANWIDILVDGDGPMADELCEGLLARHLRIREVRPEAMVAQPCGAEALPAIAARPGSVLLVDHNENADADIIFAINRPPGDAPTGTVIRHARFADLESCRAALDELRRARAETDDKTARLVRAFLDRELARARDDERACDRARDREAECATLPQAERPACTIVAEKLALDCAAARARAAVLERRMRSAAPPTPRPPSCQPE